MPVNGRGLMRAAGRGRPSWRSPGMFRYQEMLMQMNIIELLNCKDMIINAQWGLAL